MRVLVTGAAGQLGHDVINRLVTSGHQAVGTDIRESVNCKCDEYVRLDITDRDAVMECFERLCQHSFANSLGQPSVNC